MMISIIIPLYNKVKSITQTLNCVMQQSYQDFEVVVVDDGSTDGSIDIVHKFLDERIRVVSKSNGGVSSARNVGIKEAKYNYIALLDSDDYWESNYLEEQARMITDFPQAAMWGMGWGYIEKEGCKTMQAHYTDTPNLRGYVDNHWNKTKKSNIFCSSSVVIRKDVFEKVGYFDERMAYSEDLDMWWRIILNYPVAFNSKILAFYRIDAENRAMNKVIPLKRFLPFYIEKYTDYRLENSDFRRFFDRFCISGVYPYLLRGEYKKDVKRVLSQIDLSEQKFSVRFRVRFPKLFRKIYRFIDRK